MLEADALPSLAAAVGDVRDYTEAGMTFRLEEGLNSDFGVPRLNSGLSRGDAYAATQPFDWYVFGDVTVRRSYDLLLQNHPFRSGPHVEPIRDVGEMRGFTILTCRVRFTFTYTAPTQEFGSAVLSVK